MEGWKSPRLGIKFSIISGELALFYPNGDRFASYVELVAQRDRERQAKEYERQAKERERQAKEYEKERADRAEIKIEEEQRKNQQLRDRLQQLGIDPDSLH
jgi:hypothetical protein